MQSLRESNRLPRLIAGSSHDAFGELRPGHDLSGQDWPDQDWPDQDWEGRSAPAATATGLRTAPHRQYRPASRSTRGRNRLIAFGCLAAVGLIAINLPPVIKEQMRRHADTLAINAGLGVDHVAIIGHNRTKMKDIAAALDLDADKSLIGFSARDVRQRLALLPWIKGTRVTHILPTTVSIEITERRPFAIWQHNGNLALIDRTGRVLGDVSEVPEQSFPLVIGSGAEKKAGQFLDRLAKHPRVVKRVIAAIRVADRRWNLKLRSGAKVLLPEQGVGEAFKSLERLIAMDAIRKAGMKRVDLRIAGRPTVRLAVDPKRALAKLRARRINTNTASRSSRQGS